MVLGPGMVESRGGETPAVNTEKTWLSKLAIPVRKKYHLNFAKEILQSVWTLYNGTYSYTTRGVIEYVHTGTCALL